MQRRKVVELVEEKELPQTLIIGGAIIADLLTQKLEELSCHVTKTDSYYPALGKFDYIFQFGNFSAVEIAQKNYLKTTGKILFIETEKEVLPEKPGGIKIVRIGDISLWNPDRLVNILLKTIFSSNYEIVNVRKISSLKKDIYRKFTKETVPFSRSFEEKKPIVENHNFVPEVKKNFLTSTNEVFPKEKQKVLLVKKRHLVSKKSFAVFGLFILLIIIVGFSAMLFYVSSVKDLTGRFQKDMAASNPTALLIDLNEAKNKLFLAKKIYGVSDTLLFPLRSTTFMRSIGDVLSATDDLLTAGQDAFAFTIEFQKKNSGFINQSSSLTQSDLDTLNQKIISLQKSMVLAKQQMDEVDLPYFPKDDYLSFLTSISQRLSSVSDMLPVMEKLFLSDKPKLYLVLFQNSMELRPTGGFIGSFGLLAVDHGKILDFKIEDVYTADGQLKGHVDPPLPIRKYMSQPNFFLRDSNFDPDFAASSIQAEFFLNKELGKSADGVIGFNLFVVQKILQTVGPVKLPDFNNDEINAENFFFKAQYYSQNKFFPGSTQKRDFLTAMTNVLIDRLSSNKGFTMVDLLPVIKQSLDEKNLLLYSNDGQTQDLIEKQGWGGRTVEVKCLSNSTTREVNDLSNPDKCYPDYLSIIEANLGVNKANYFVSKSEAVEKKIGADGRIVTVLTLSYQNSSTPEIYSNDTYTNYIRVFVPVGSHLDSVTLNDVPMSANDVDLQNYELDKMSFGFLIKIAPENKGIVKVTYTLPRPVTTAVSEYQLFFQKQGGDKVAPFVLSFTYPPQFSFSPANFKSTSGGNTGEVYYSTDTSVDRIFAFNNSIQ
ncbi:DUF4012 domain-containing protein [Patescibacteria group bacterium]|nr:DUF4012 domain-containing protein [Patescibacteria group bacterium]MCL5797199.1 DUF4012 domain-containing protein [Patescibacteria group bacterium]